MKRLVGLKKSKSAFNKNIITKTQQGGYYDEKEKNPDEFVALGYGKVGAYSAADSVTGCHRQGYKPDDIALNQEQGYGPQIRSQVHQLGIG